MPSRSRERQATDSTLVGSDDIDGSSEDMPRKPKQNPLSREVWFAILIMWSEPICGTVIFPFINALVRDTGVTGGDEAKTGYYAGVIVRANTIL